MSDEVHKITIQTQPPKGSFPGRVEVGYYVVADQSVILTDEKGHPIGGDGTKRILAERYDVIVLDLMLPEQSGFEVLERVRHRVRAPIIVLTARADLPDRLRAFELGAADFVAKPFWIIGRKVCAAR